MEKKKRGKKPRLEGLMAIVRDMLRDGVPLELIVKYTGLPPERILEVKF
ncbi:MAG: hypothetical protein ACOYD6_09685 [Limnochordia bacterium]